MSLTPGTRVGVYEVTAQIGEGGMGQVFRATDTKLKRQVAIKILPPSLATDSDRLARFQREAEVLASLNHPNIASIYGLEESGGITALAMELVEGEDLSRRIARGAIPIDEALPIAKQIVDALEAAHDQGIIHRDLKPANIKVRPDGTVKVLDFGLAKAMDTAAGSSPDLSMSPTLSIHATQAGIILGTAAYMSPEQARGKTVDKRADIWAFGCVLYEMLTGRRAFRGDDITETIAAIMRDDPHWSALPAETPAGVRRVLGLCLQKDPRLRLRDIGDARFLFDLAGPDSAGAPAARMQRRTVIVAAIVAVAALAAGWSAARFASPSSGTGAASAVFSTLAPPGDAVSAFSHGFALSPDGRTVVFSARTQDGVQRLWKRQLDRLMPEPLAGTDGGIYPFWSPDGRQIAFFSGAALRRISADGGPPQTICAVNGYRQTGSWNERDLILFSESGTTDRIFQVPADGGVPPKPLGSVGERAWNPKWLPGGRFFLFSSQTRGRADIRVGAIDGSRQPSAIAVAPEGRDPDEFGFGFGPPDRVFYSRAGALVMQRLNTRTLELTGPPVPLAGQVGTPVGWYALSAAQQTVVALAHYSSASTGSPGDPLSRLAWVNRRGDVVGVLGSVDRYWTLRLSPDGSRAAANRTGGLWIVETNTDRATFVGGDAMAGVWSADGTRLLYHDEVSGGRTVVKGVAEEGPGIALPLGSGSDPTDWSRDGRLILSTESANEASGTDDIALFDMGTRTSRPWLSTRANERQARFSPNGEWIAYVSDQTGTEQVYVRRLAGDPIAHPVSVSGGVYPSWRRDGRELFFLSPGDEMMAVDIAPTGATMTIGEPKRLFKVFVNDVASRFYSPYDVSPDGQRFLINVPEPPESALIIQNVVALLNSR